MKTLFAAIAAGLLGGGIAVGAVALNLVPVQPKSNEVTAKAGPLEMEGGEGSAARSTDYDQQIADLKQQVETLQVQLSKAKSGDSSEDVAALRKEVEALKKAGKTAPATTGDGETIDVSDAPATTEQFKAAVRNVMDERDAEKQEQKRMDAQAARLDQLEKQKQQIADFIPKLVQNQATKLNIPEASVQDVSNALVQHAQFRAEIASEMRGLRIDGKDVDQDAYKKKFDDLNQTTISALTSYVDQDTAEKLVSAIDRVGRNNGRDQGGNNRRQGRRGRGGNNN